MTIDVNINVSSKTVVSLCLYLARAVALFPRPPSARNRIPRFCSYLLDESLARPSAPTQFMQPRIINPKMMAQLVDHSNRHLLH